MAGGETVIVHDDFHIRGGIQLGEPAIVTAAFVRGCEESARRISSATSSPVMRRAECEHIGVVMRAGQAGGGDVMRQPAANRRMAVGGDRHADARAADQNAEIGALFRHRARRRPGQNPDNRRWPAVGAEIEHLMASLDQRGGKPVFQGSSRHGRRPER